MSTYGTPAPPDDFLDEAPRRPRRFRALWLVLLLLFLAMLACGALVVGAVLVYLLTASEQEVTAEDRALVVDIEALAAQMNDYTPEAEYETLSKKRYLDRSIEVDYEYDAPEGSGAPYLNCTVSLERTERDARMSYLGILGSGKFGMSVLSGRDVKVVVRDDLFRWGDQSQFTLLESAGKPCGNFFIARKGKAVFYLMIAGVYFDDGESFGELVLPVLRRLENRRETRLR